MINISFRTPAQFLEEVLLVDDFSDKEDLGEVKLKKNRRKRLQELFQGLKNYIRIFRGLVRLVRNSEREGLIRLINNQRPSLSSSSFSCLHKVSNARGKGGEGSGGGVS